MQRTDSKVLDVPIWELAFPVPSPEIPDLNRPTDLFLFSPCGNSSHAIALFIYVSILFSLMPMCIPDSTFHVSSLFHSSHDFKNYFHSIFSHLFFVFKYLSLRLCEYSHVHLQSFREVLAFFILHHLFSLSNMYMLNIFF